MLLRAFDQMLLETENGVCIVLPQLLLIGVWFVLSRPVWCYGVLCWTAL